MNTYTTKEGQTLLDISLQLYGSVDYLVKVCADNALDLNNDLAGNSTLLYDVELFNLSPISNQLRLDIQYLSTAGELIENTQPAITPLLEHSESEFTNEEHN